MQSVVLSCLFGVVAAMVIWVTGSAAVSREELMRRGGRLCPPEEL